MLSRKPISSAPISALPSGGAPPRSFSISPNDVYTGMGIAHTFTLLGSGTNWNTGPATFTVVSGPATKISQTVSDDTHGTISLTTAGGGGGTVVISDGISSNTINVGVATITPTPSTIISGTTGNSISLTGAHTLWSVDSPTFGLSGGVGASITGQSISGNTAATITVNAGSSPTVLTITDPSTGATCSITVSPPAATTKKVCLVSPFYSSDPAFSGGTNGYQLKKWSSGSLISDGSHVTSGLTALTGQSGAYGWVVEATLTLDPDGGYRGIVVWDTGGGSPIYAADEVYVPPAPTGGSGPAGGPGSVSIVLVDSAGNPRASLTGLRGAWFDQARPDLFSTPRQTFTGLTTNSSGVLLVTLTNTLLTSGQVGFLIISDTDGTTTQTPAAKAFAGPVALT